MRVLLIHQAFVAGDEAGGTRHFEFGRRLATHGDRLTVVASQVSYLTGQRINARSSQPLGRQYVDGVEILRAYAPSITHRGFGWRVVGFVVFALTSLVAGLRAGPADIVMGTSPPLFQALSSWCLARLRRRPYLLEVRDLWPEFAIEMGVLRNPVLRLIARRIEAFLYHHADHLLVNSPAYVDYLRGKGVCPERISCIPNGVDPSMFLPEPGGAEVRSRFGLENKIVVTYAGAFGMANDLGTLITAARRLREDSRIHFLLVGDGKSRASLETACHQYGLTNVTFAGPVPKMSLPAVLAASDICVATLMNIPHFTTTYPNKVFDYMAAGRPIVLAIDGVIRDVIERAGAGVFAQPGDAEDVARAILRLAGDPELRRRLGASGRSYVVVHFNRAQQADTFRILAHSLLSCRETREVPARNDRRGRGKR